MIGGVPPQVEQLKQVHQDAQVPHQGDQVPIVGGGNKAPAVLPAMANWEIIKALLTLA